MTTDLAAAVTPHLAPGNHPPGGPDADRPPGCPVCQQRLVIITSRSARDDTGVYIRRQLWGCPRGHALVDYSDGAWGPIDVLPEV